jgi:hypothetical protein
MSGGYIQFQSPQIRAIPVIPFNSEELNAEQIGLQVRIAELAKKIQKNYTDSVNSTCDSEIDYLVYQLFSLTQDEITLIEAFDL